MTNNTNLLITFVRGRYTVVFLRSLFPSQTMHAYSNVYLLRYILAAKCAHQ